MLQSILEAKIPEEVSLVFRGHKGVSKEVLSLCNSFNWPFGEKIIEVDPQKLNLDENLLECMNLSHQFGSVIVLEDDLLVSPFFYQYTVAAQTTYAKNDEVAGIGLYKYQLHPIDKGRFYPLQQNQNTYFIQKTCTWGQSFTSKQWQAFTTWKSQNKIDSFIQLLPNYMRNYGFDNWELQHNCYLISQGKFMSQPILSLSSNRGIAGSHHNSSLNSDLFKVPLQSVQDSYCFSTFKTSIHYDAYFELTHKTLIELLPDNHAISQFDFDVDLTGMKPLECFSKKLVLTRKGSKFSLEKYASALVPFELNVIYEIAGNEIVLCEKKDLLKGRKANLKMEAKRYFGNSVDVSWRKWLIFKYLSFVDRKRNK